MEIRLRKFLRLVLAGPFFFVSAWLLMVFAGVLSSHVGIRAFGYTTSMVATIALWLVLAPAINAGSAPSRKRSRPSRE